MVEALCLVLIPGQLSTERMWAAQVRDLADSARVLIVDQNRADTIVAIARSVLEQMPPRCVLAAHGMGGFIAFEILRQAPERVLALALLDTLAPADNAAQTARRERYLELAAAGRFPAIIDERIPQVVHPARRGDPEVEGVVREMAEQTGVARFTAQTRAIMGRADSRPMLGTIRCPTVLIWGRQDGMATHEHQLELQQRIPGARLEVLEDTGHFTTLERPAEVSRILRELLGRFARASD